MKMLFLTIDYPPQKGGVARYSEALCRYFKDDITVIAHNACLKGENPPESEISVKYTTVLGKHWPKWLKAIKILKNNPTDLVITSHILPLGLVSLIHKIITKTPYVVILHGMDFALATRNPWKTALTKTILKHASIIVANTKNLQTELKTFTNKKVILAYPMPGIKGNQVNQNTTKIRITSIARLVERKGIQRVIQAIKKLPELHNKIEYIITGADTPFRKTLETNIKANNLQKIIKILPNQTDKQIKQILEKTNIFALPTITKAEDKEGFGIAYTEAATFAIPSIASNLPGVKEAILHNKTGILVNSDQELKSAIKTLVLDNKLRDTLGKAAKQRIDSNFQPDQVFQELKTAIKNL